MSIQTEKLFSLLDVPQFGSMVHWAGGDQKTMRIEAQTDNFHFMTFQRVPHWTIIRVPNFGCPIEWARDYEVAKRIVERHGVNDVFVLF